MSIDVTLRQLAQTLTRFDRAYLVTIGDDARAHVVDVSTTLRDDTLIIADPGRRTRANVAARPSVTLVWPPTDPDDHSLIMDGAGALRDDALTVTPTRAVLHRSARPASGTGGGGCDSDCVELPVAGTARG